MDTHDVVDIRHKTLHECLRDYFNHPEAKAANPRGIGVLEGQHVVVVDQVYTGKETNQVLEELADESEGTLPYEDAQVFGHYGLAQAIIAHGVKNVAEASGMPPRTLYEATKGRKQSAADVRRILDGLNACPPAHGCCADGTTPAELVEQRRRGQRVRGHGHVGAWPQDDHAWLKSLWLREANGENEQHRGYHADGARPQRVRPLPVLRLGPRPRARQPP